MAIKEGEFYDAYDVVDDHEIDERHCPRCHGSNLDYDSTDYGTTTVYMRYKCADCGLVLEHHYEFSGVYIPYGEE